MREAPDNTKRVLMVALEFPPCQSAGVIRTASFVRSLPALGWQPLVLTARTGLYRHTDPAGLSTLPNDLIVRRTFALDSARSLAIRGKYLDASATPDRYVTWLLPAVLRGLAMIRRYRPAVVWSTYPVATAHWVAAILARLSGLPWIADYRDPAGFHYDPDAPDTRLARRVDRLAAERAAYLVFTTERARQLYIDGYAGLSAGRTAVIENGFDETFTVQARQDREPAEEKPERLVLHSGSLYGGGRCPDELIRAVARVNREKTAEQAAVRLRFRGIAPKKAHLEQVASLGAERSVEFAPRIPFADAVAEMESADVLVLIQPELFTYQVPGKLYEYIASGRPIVAITPRSSATAERLTSVGSAIVVDNDEEGIAKALGYAFSMAARTESVAPLGRAARTAELADLVERALGNQVGGAAGQAG